MTPNLQVAERKRTIEDVDADIKNIDWKTGDQQDGLTRFYRLTVERIEMAIAYYEDNIPKARAKAFIFWGILVLFLTVGALLPLVAVSNLFDADAEMRLKLTSIGYIALAFAGITYLVGNLYGVSTNWQRFMVTKLSLRLEVYNLHLAWIPLAIFLSDKEFDFDKNPSLVESFMTTARKAQEHAAAETLKWEASMAEAFKAISDKLGVLEQEVNARFTKLMDEQETAKAKSSISKIGAIIVTVENIGIASKPVQYSVDNSSRGTITKPNSQFSIAAIEAGLHEVRISGEARVDNKSDEYHFDVPELLFVTANQIEKITMALPMPQKSVPHKLVDKVEPDVATA